MVQQQIKAIETRYAGCRFRSRLEARWAVFLDALGIPWEYEPQGFELPSGRYLPDFWLPECKTWFEVKGKPPDERERRVLADFARQLPGANHPAGGSAFSPEWEYLKVAVGDIPRPGQPCRDVMPLHPTVPTWSPGWIWRIIDIDGRPNIHSVFWQKCPRGHAWVGSGICWVCLYLIGDQDSAFHNDFSLLFCGPTPFAPHHPSIGTNTVHPDVKNAQQAARSARFEHGEQG